MRTLIPARGLSLLRARTSSFTTATHKLKIENLELQGQQKVFSAWIT
jgi:hypothetical protein